MLHLPAKETQPGMHMFLFFLCFHYYLLIVNL